MSIEKLPVHYSMQNHATIYDEEALTALELAARTTGKVNEVVEAQNTLERETNEHLAAQDKELADRLALQDDKLDTFQNETIPETVAADVKEHIANGEFDEAIDKYAGDLERRVDNLLGSVSAGSTTMDAEIIDARTDAGGTKHSNLGSVTRTLDTRTRHLKEQAQRNFYFPLEWRGFFKVEYSGPEAIVTFPLAFAFNHGTGQNIYHPLTDDLLSEYTATNYVTERTEQYYKIKMPAHTYLVWNMDDEVLSVQTAQQLYYSHFPLLVNNYGSISGGYLLPYLNSVKAEKSVTDIEAVRVSIKQKVDGNYYIPLEWRQYLNVTKQGDGSLLVEFPKYLNGNTKGGNWSLPVTLTEYTATNYVVSEGEKSYVLKLPANTCLAYQWEEATIGVQEVRQLGEKHIVLLMNNYAFVSGGYLVDFLQNRTLDEHAALLSETEKAASPEDIATVTNFSKLFNTTNSFDSFVFMTDPHPVHDGAEWWNTVNDYVTDVKKYRDMTGAEFVVSGGDWLNDTTTQAEAATALSYIYGKMRGAFQQDFHLICGNHDTNYQGKKDDSSDINTGYLSPEIMRNLWYKDKANCYYRFDTENAAFFILDSQLDWYLDMDAYKTAQGNFLINGLKANTKENIVLGVHFLVDCPFTEKMCEIAAAFNSRGTITFDGVTHSFAGCAGRVRFIFGGHNHADTTGTIKGIPYFTTRNYFNGKSIDFVFIDYDAGLVTLTRKGSGNSRTLTI